MLGYVNLPDVAKPRRTGAVPVATPTYTLPPSPYEADAKRLWDLYTKAPAVSVQGQRMLPNYGSFRSWVQDNQDRLYRQGLIPNQFRTGIDPMFSAALAAQSL
jgi:hypothetical protein